jgi:hypothetical protein
MSILFEFTQIPEPQQPCHPLTLPASPGFDFRRMVVISTVGSAEHEPAYDGVVTVGRAIRQVHTPAEDQAP